MKRLFAPESISTVISDLNEEMANVDGNERNKTFLSDMNQRLNSQGKDAFFSHGQIKYLRSLWWQFCKDTVEESELSGLERLKQKRDNLLKRIRKDEIAQHHAIAVTASWGIEATVLALAGGQPDAQMKQAKYRQNHRLHNPLLATDTTASG